MQQLKLFEEHLERSAERFQDLRRDVIEPYGPKLQSAVVNRIGPSRKVRTWQEVYQGSRGGYAAVRPKAKTYHNGRAVGAITTAIESGHAPGYHQTSRVAGKYMYLRSMPDAARISAEAAQELKDKLQRVLED